MWLSPYEARGTWRAEVGRLDLARFTAKGATSKTYSMTNELDVLLINSIREIHLLWASICDDMRLSEWARISRSRNHGAGLQPLHMTQVSYNRGQSMHKYSVPRETAFRKRASSVSGSTRPHRASAKKQCIQLDTYNTRREYESSACGSTHSAYARIRCPLYLHAPCTLSWSAVPSISHNCPRRDPSSLRHDRPLHKGPAKLAA